MRASVGFVACLAAACARPSGATPVTAIEVGRATTPSTIGDAPAAEGACLIRGHGVLDVKVRAGEETFDLRVNGVPTESELAKDGVAVVHVGGPIAFDGRVALAAASDASEASLHTTREVATLGGLVKLGKNVELVHPHRVDAAASGTALLGSTTVEDVPVPCDALVIDFRSVTAGQQITDLDDAREIAWVAARGDALTVCASPAGTAPCVTTRELVFEEVRRANDSVEVRARFDDGSVVHGWARADHVMKSDGPAPMGYGSTGGCGCGRRMLAHLRIGKPDPREHFGKARLKKGAAIYAQADGRGEWARATEELEIDIEMHGGDEYARVTDLPGLSTTVGCSCPGMADHAFVKREAVAPIR